MKINNAGSRVERLLCAISDLMICYGPFVPLGQEEEEEATVLLHCREQMEKAPEPLVESWSEVLPCEIDGSFAVDGFGPGLRLL